MDQIKIENLEIFANHGVYPEENRSQSLTVQSAVSFWFPVFYMWIHARREKRMIWKRL